MTLSFGWSSPSPSRREEQEWRRAIEPLLDRQDPRGLIVQAERLNGGWSIFITVSDSHSALEASPRGASADLQLKISYWYLKEQHPLAQQILAALNAAGKNVTLAPLPPPQAPAVVTAGPEGESA
jgi:hypothetical protein